MENENGQKTVKKIFRIIVKIIIISILLVGVMWIIKIAPNYMSNEITDKTNLVINYSNVTGRMKHEMVIENDDTVYISMADIRNYYDDNIYYDKQYDQIVTSSDTKLAVFKIDENSVTINGNVKAIKGKATQIDGVYYLPISDMEEIYNIKVSHLDNKILIESLDNKLTTATVSKKEKVRSKTTFFSKSVDDVDIGEKVAIIEMGVDELPAGWEKVRTPNGNIGYIESKNLKNITVERENKVYGDYFSKDKKISLAWEYFSEYGSAPDNTGITYDGVNVVSPSFFHLKLEDTQKEKLGIMDVISQANLVENIGDEGTNYINWAKSNGYKVWPKVSNETLPTTIDEFSCIINDYKLRQIIINDILARAKTYNLDGINVDFEYMYEGDKEAFSRFIIELAPQLRNIGVCLSVDVTAPDGGENWSLCYDRRVIGEVADYIVFMGYDQYGTNRIGSTSTYNWLENNVNKFIKNENVAPEKLILGLPFYSKVWQTQNGNTIKGTAVAMKNMEASIPEGSSKEWIDEIKQYYVEYQKDGYVYKLWVEDDKSFAEKLSLVEKYNLGGTAYWRKGLETDSIWNIVKQKLNL